MDINVAMAESQSLLGFELAAGAETTASVPLPAGTIPVGVSPSSLAVAPNESRIYVTNIGSNTVSVIDATTNTVIRNPIAFGIQPRFVAVTRTGVESM